MEGLTLAPDILAKPGHRFVFTGPNKGGECDECPVQKMCFNLTPGRPYEVETVRDVTHPCNLHEGRMRVVTVKPGQFETTLETKRLRGTAATFVPIDCGFAECENWKLCHPTGVETDCRYTIDEIKESIDCPLRYPIKRVVLKSL